MTDLDDVLAEQVRYYRERATEYDATSTPAGDPFAASGAWCQHEIRRLVTGGRVIELAAGTGQWTVLLAGVADRLTVTDSSAEMLELNRARVGDHPTVSWVTGDALGGIASSGYDIAFFGFFLSHVPRGRFAAFWRATERLLAPEGRAVFVDEGDPGVWPEDWIDRDAGIVRRRLLDGSVHRAVKVHWRADDLRRELRAVGWSASIRTSGPFFVGEARPPVH